MHDNVTGDHVLSWVGNVASIGAVVSAFVGWLPPAAALVAIIWYMIQIYESDTVQGWRKRRRNVRLARLKARVMMMEAQNKPDLPGLDG
jgi:hypothetical protein